MSSCEQKWLITILLKSTLPSVCLRSQRPQLCQNMCKNKFIQIPNKTWEVNMSCVFVHVCSWGERGKKKDYHLQRQYAQRPLVSDNLLSYQAHSGSAVDRLNTEVIQTDSHVSIIWSSSRFHSYTLVQVQVQVELYCHSAACGDIQWNEMSCLTGPRCYINTDIQHYKPIHKLTY